MGTLTILGIVVIVVALAALFRIKPKEGRPAGRTHLMSAARVVLVVIGLILLFAALR